MEYKWVCPERIEECYEHMKSCPTCDLSCPLMSEMHGCKYMEVEVCNQYIVLI